MSCRGQETIIANTEVTTCTLLSRCQVLRDSMASKQYTSRRIIYTLIIFWIGVLCGGLIFRTFIVIYTNTCLAARANEINNSSHVFMIIVQRTRNFNDRPLIHRLLDGDDTKSTVFHCSKHYEQNCDRIGHTRLRFSAGFGHDCDWLVVAGQVILGTRNLVKMLTTFPGRSMPVAFIYPNCDSLSVLVVNRKALLILVADAQTPELNVKSACEFRDKIGLYSLQMAMTKFDWTQKESSSLGADMKIPISQSSNETSLSYFAIKHLERKLQMLLIKSSYLKYQINYVNIKQESLRNVHVLPGDAITKFRYIKEWDFINVSYVHSLANYNCQPWVQLKNNGRQLLFDSTRLYEEAANQSRHIFAYQRVTPTHGVEHLVLNMDSSSPYFRSVQSYDEIKFKETRERSGPNIVLVLPLYKRSAILSRFLKRLNSVSLVYRGLLVLQVVLYKDRHGEYIRTLQTAHAQSGKVIVNIVQAEGRFSRAVALEMGTADLPDNTRMLFIDVDMLFTATFLHRVVHNTIQGRQIFFPISFSRYDPRTLRNKSNRTSKRSVYDQHFGTWRYFSFGIVGIYKSDLAKVGHFDTRLKGWGKEDVMFYEACVGSEIEVFRAVEPGLWHMYHARVCDRHLSADQLEMCRQSRLQLQSSQRSLAEYVLEVLP